MLRVLLVFTGQGILLYFYGVVTYSEGSFQCLAFSMSGFYWLGVSTPESCLQKAFIDISWIHVHVLGVVTGEWQFVRLFSVTISRI